MDIKGEDGAAEMRGVLSRRKGIFSSWVKFTYVKKDNYLFEFKLGANHFSSEPLHMFELLDSLVEDASLITGKQFSFAIHTSNGKSCYFLAITQQEKERWMQILTAKSPAPSAVKASSSSSPFPSPSPASSALRPISAAGSSSSFPGRSPSQPSFERASSQHGSSLNEDLGEYATQISVNSSITSVELENKIPILKYLESFVDAVIVGNINGMIVAINSAAEKLFSITKANAQGEPLTLLMPEPFKSQHDGYLFRHEKFGSEKLIGKTRNLKGERNGTSFDLQISLGKLPIKGYFIATIRELDLSQKQRTKEEN